jgi:hypothetical protein
MPKKLEDLTGQVFNKLTVIECVGSNKHQKRLWKCQCECGSNKEVIITGNDLKRGHTKSCGCLIKTRNDWKKQELKGTSFYQCWQGIKKRCNNKNCKGYENYGGRGITYQENWNDFINFKNDMYDSYLIHCKEYGEENTSIDRINVNDNYDKNNCRWATRQVQNENKRNNIFITFNDKIKTITEWSKIYNLNYTTLKRRYDKIIKFNLEITEVFFKSTEEFNNYFNKLKLDY